RCVALCITGPGTQHGHTVRAACTLTAHACSTETLTAHACMTETLTAHACKTETLTAHA
ncbi:Hypothetical predicted protein, partial [Pelobates cultripes]